MSCLVSDAFDICGPISLTRACMRLASVGISGVCSEELGNTPRLARAVQFQGSICVQVSRTPVAR